MKKFTFLTTLVFIAAFTRFIPHPPNLTAVVALSLFGGTVFDKKVFAFAMPLIAMMLTDAILGFHGTMFWVYGAILLISFFGIKLAKMLSVRNLILATLLSSVVFFIVTNFGMWVSTPLYPKTAEGLMACYTAAIPFFRNELLGNMLFTGALFAAHHFAGYRVLAVKTAK